MFDLVYSGDSSTFATTSASMPFHHISYLNASKLNTIWIEVMAALNLHGGDILKSASKNQGKFVLIFCSEDRIYEIFMTRKERGYIRNILHLFHFKLIPLLFMSRKPGVFMRNRFYSQLRATLTMKMFIV